MTEGRSASPYALAKLPKLSRREFVIKGWRRLYWVWLRDRLRLGLSWAIFRRLV